MRDWLQRAAQETIDRSPSVAYRLLERARAAAVPGSEAWAALAVQSLEAATNAGMVAEALALGTEVLAHPMAPDTRAMARWWYGGSLFMAQRSADAALQFELAAQEFSSAVTGPSSSRTRRWRVWDLHARPARCDRVGPRRGERVRRSACAEPGHVPRVRRLGSSMRFTESLPFARQAMEVAATDPSGTADRYQPSFFLGLVLFDLARFDEALQAIRHGQQRAEAHGASWADALYLQLRSMVLYQMGRLDEADADAAAGVAATEETGSGIGLLWSLAVLALVALHRGRMEEAGALVDRAEAAFLAATRPWASISW